MAQMRNSRYAKENYVFIMSCKLLAKIEPTPRQASKWRARTGVAWQAFNRMPLHKKTEFLKGVRAKEIMLSVKKGE